MSGSKYAIVGGGMVAGYAAKKMVELGLKSGDLTIFSADTAYPYERPPLSKGFLAGNESEESITIKPAEFYREHGIDVRLGCKVTALDAHARKLSLSTGESFGFEKMIAATGSRVRELDVPGAEGVRIRYLRSLADSKKIRQRAEGVKRAAVVGGSFIGMEVASVLAQKEIEVTMILRDGRIWERFFTPEMSAFFEAYYSERGVRFVKNVRIAALRGKHTVRTAGRARGQTIRAELVVAGVGVQPETELFAKAGLDTSDGLMVNEYLETPEHSILAAGDIANYQDVIFEKRRRVEHWDNAVSQGEHCAQMILGTRAPFHHVPYFFSDVFDLSYEFWGDTEGADATITRGEMTGEGFSVWWLRDGRVVAAFVMKRPDEEREVAPAWIEGKQRVDSGRLADAAMGIREAAYSGSAK